MAKNNYAEKWLLKKELVFNKYGGRCSYCGCEININKFQIDHIIPKLQFKIHSEKLKEIRFDDINNLNPACCSCNNYKRAHSLEIFRKEVEQQIKRLRRDHSTFRLAERYGLVSCTEIKIIFYFEKLKNNG